MLKDMKFGTKLGLIVAVGVIGLGVVAFAALRAERMADAAVSRMSGTELQLVIGFDDLYALGLQTEQATRNIILDPRDDTARKNYANAHAEFVRTVETLIPIASAATRPTVETIRQKWTEDHALKLAIQRLATEGKRDEAMALLVKQETPLWRQVKAIVLELEKAQKQAYVTNKEETLAELRFQKLWIGVTVFLALAAFLAFSIPTARVTARRVDLLTQAALLIAKGDLREDPRVDGRDEVGILARSFQQMVGRLREIVSTLKSASHELGAAAERLMEDTRAQASMLERQASGVTETTATTRELEQTASLAAVKAAAVLEVARRGAEMSEAGRGNAERSLTELQRIQVSVEDIIGRSGHLLEQTRSVGDIVETVQDLAVQSHVLSLNASIEAARAGEAGRSFAVVAQEVRALAEQSGTGASRIARMVQEILTAVQETRAMTEAGKAGVEGSLGQIRVSGESLKEIGGIVEETSAAAVQIAAAVQQQSTGIAQIATAMRDIDNGMEETLVRIRSLSSASEQVAETATRISGIADEFQV